MKFNNVEIVPGGISLKLYRSLEKALKLQVRKFWGLISAFGEAIGEKRGEVFSLLSPFSQ